VAEVPIERWPPRLLSLLDSERREAPATSSSRAHTFREASPVAPNQRVSEVGVARTGRSDGARAVPHLSQNAFPRCIFLPHCPQTMGVLFRSITKATNTTVTAPTAAIRTVAYVIELAVSVSTTASPTPCLPTGMFVSYKIISPATKPLLELTALISISMPVTLSYQRHSASGTIHQTSIETGLAFRVEAFVP